MFRIRPISVPGYFVSLTAKYAIKGDALKKLNNFPALVCLACLVDLACLVCFFGLVSKQMQ